jgi:hypothetical protein
LKLNPDAVPEMVCNIRLLPPLVVEVEDDVCVPVVTEAAVEVEAVAGCTTGVPRLKNEATLCSFKVGYRNSAS